MEVPTYHSWHAPIFVACDPYIIISNIYPYYYLLPLNIVFVAGIVPTIAIPMLVVSPMIKPTSLKQKPTIHWDGRNVAGEQTVGIES